MSLKYIYTAALTMLVATQCFSQAEKNLYLFYSKDSPLLSNVGKYGEDEILTFDISLISCELRKPITVGNDGKLSSLNQRIVSNFSLTYININHSNDSVLVHKQNVKSYFYMEFLMEFVDSRNWFELQSQFDNIYVIEQDKLVLDQYIARKVKVITDARM